MPSVETEVLVEELKGSLHEVMICLSHSWGGLEQVVANDAVDRAQLGLRTRLLCLEGTPIHQSLSKRSEVELIPINWRPRDHFDLNLRKEIHRFVDEGVNLFHTHQPSLLGSISPWLWQFPKVSLLASRHIMNSHDKRGIYHRAIYRRVDVLVAMSQTLKENILATHPLKERQVRVINLGLDFDRFDPERVDPKEQRARWGADEETVVIGLVGRIDPAKGQGTFIKAAAGLIKGKRPGERFKFVIVGEETLGSSGDYVTELQEMARQFRIEDTIVFAGFQENIPEVMRAFDIFVMPSRQEAFGLVAIEAMAMECAIAISSGGSAGEIVGQEEFGLLMRPDDAFDLQRQLRRMLDNPLERVEMGQRARAHVKKHYGKPERIRKTLELYERCLRRRRAL